MSWNNVFQTVTWAAPEGGNGCLQLFRSIPIASPTPQKGNTGQLSIKKTYESLTRMISKTFAKSRPLLAHLTVNQSIWPSTDINETHSNSACSGSGALTQGSTWWHICIKIIKHVQRRGKLRVKMIPCCWGCFGKQIVRIDLSLHGFLKCFFWRMYCLERAWYSSFFEFDWSCIISLCSQPMLKAESKIHNGPFQNDLLVRLWKFAWGWVVSRLRCSDVSCGHTVGRRSCFQSPQSVSWFQAVWKG